MRQSQKAYLPLRKQIHEEAYREERIIEFLRKIPKQKWPKLGRFMTALAEDAPEAIELLKRGHSGEIDFHTALDLFEGGRPD